MPEAAGTRTVEVSIDRGVLRARHFVTRILDYSIVSNLSGPCEVGTILSLFYGQENEVCAGGVRKEAKAPCLSVVGAPAHPALGPGKGDGFSVAHLPPRKGHMECDVRAYGAIVKRLSPEQVPASKAAQ